MGRSDHRIRTEVWRIRRENSRCEGELCELAAPSRETRRRGENMGGTQEISLSDGIRRRGGII